MAYRYKSGREAPETGTTAAAAPRRRKREVGDDSVRRLLEGSLRDATAKATEAHAEVAAHEKAFAEARDRYQHLRREADDEKQFFRWREAGPNARARIAQMERDRDEAQRQVSGIIDKLGEARQRAARHDAEVKRYQGELRQHRGK